jgi:hypothetical protein
MALGMTLILKALQHGSVGMVGDAVFRHTGVVAAGLVVGVPPPARGGRVDRCSVDGGGLRADFAAPLRRF